MSLHEIAMLFKEKLGDKAKNVSTKVIPDWLVRVAALFKPEAKAIVPLLGRVRNTSNEKARTMLGWSPRTNEESVLATAESLFRYNSIKS
jgi:dihydroflavonol-4-reductase